MQDIVFYVAASETIGTVRNYANTRNQTAPVLALGVSACLRMRLFTIREGATPYPIASFNGIVDWQWSMDDCFDRNTACKLKADIGDISVHTVTDTVNGETMNFTEFVIPISDMNTQELAAWLGSRTMSSGLTGELVGYDSTGNAVFVLQIENFTVRNRIAGLGDPTVLDQEIVTRTQAEYLIQAAVSSSADSKQDKLTSSNAGIGISISSGGTISTANVPQSAISGLSAALAVKQDAITAGDLIEISGVTVNRKRYMAIKEDAGIPTRNIAVPNSTATVAAYVLEPGNAYKIHVASTNKWLATTADYKSSSGTWGIEGHIELFVAGTGYVRTDSNVVLANALEPDSVNNCTVRFHDGLAIISVEDHVAGYIVISATGSTAGTLPYALGSASQEYIAFNDTLAGLSIDMGGVTTNGEKHVVGNGYADTIITGGVSCAGKTTFANLSMNDVAILGGTPTLGDVYIPDGGTVTFNDNRPVFEKVVGNGGTLNYNGHAPSRTSGTSDYAFISGVTITSGVSTYGGAFWCIKGGAIDFVDVVFSGNTGTSTGGCGLIQSGAVVNMLRCTEIDNTGGITGGDTISNDDSVLNATSCTFNNAAGKFDILVQAGGAANLKDCVVHNNLTIRSNSHVAFAGSNTLLGSAYSDSTSGGGSAVISSGAILDFTGNANAVPMKPFGGITFEPGGATVYPSAGSASAYMLDNVTVPKLGNTNAIDLAQTSITATNAATVVVAGATIRNGYREGIGGAFSAVDSGTKLNISNCLITGNSASSYAGAIGANTSALVNVVSCVISGNTAATHNGAYAQLGAKICFSGCDLFDKSVVGPNGIFEFSGSNNLHAITSGAEIVIHSGAIIDLTGNTFTTPVSCGSGGIVVSGGCTVVNSAGVSVSIAGGTYSQINNDGTTVPAQEE